MQFIKNLLFKLSAAILFIAFLTAYGVAKTPVPQAAAPKMLQTNGHTLQVDLALTDEQREVGLSGVESIPDDYAKLFVFNEMGQHGIWMKGMKFPLDIAWLDKEGKIVETRMDVPVSESANPPIYTNDEAAIYVVEMKAGSFEKFGIEMGEQLALDELIDETSTI